MGHRRRQRYLLRDGFSNDATSIVTATAPSTVINPKTLHSVSLRKVDMTEGMLRETGDSTKQMNGMKMNLFKLKANVEIL